MHTHFRLPLLIAAVLIAALLPLAPPSHAQDNSSTGRIAIVGADGNMHLYDVASDTFTRLTDDAIDTARRYAWPTWSTDGQLAYFGTNVAQQPYYRLGIFLDALDGSGPQQVYAAEDEVFTYAYWSPADCGTGNCRDLAVLYTGRGGDLAVRRVRSLDSGAEVTIDELAQGGPFYWDWSPDGTTLFVARFSEQLVLLDAEAGEVVQTFDDTLGLQRAVDWSPVDNRLLAAVESGARTSDLVVFDDTERMVLAEDVRGIVAFEWSPDGTQVAYADDDGGLLFIVDAATGAERTLVSDNVVGFFWSPDGRKLAYITLTREGNDVIARQEGSNPVLRWYVYEPETGVSQRFASFLPSQEMLYYLQFFDQFARSHRLWSPDSRYLTYGEWRQIDDSFAVMLLDTDSPGSPPQELMAGDIGVFAWE